MKYTHIITSDNEEQCWLDSFNNYSGYNFKMNEMIELSIILIYIVERFNHEIACGPAIIIEEIKKPYSNEDYIKAKNLGLDLDDWEDYKRYYKLEEYAAIT